MHLLNRPRVVPQFELPQRNPLHLNAVAILAAAGRPTAAEDRLNAVRGIHTSRLAALSSLVTHKRGSSRNALGARSRRPGTRRSTPLLSRFRKHAPCRYRWRFSHFSWRSARIDSGTAVWGARQLQLGRGKPMLPRGEYVRSVRAKTQRNDRLPVGILGVRQNQSRYKRPLASSRTVNRPSEASHLSFQSNKRTRRRALPIAPGLRTLPASTGASSTCRESPGFL